METAQSRLAALGLALALVMTSIGVACVAGCGEESGGTTSAASSATARNAADEYRSLHAALDPRLIADLKNAHGVLAPDLERSLGSAQPVVDRLVWATRLERCDWAIDYSTGLFTELPHLAQLRDLARLLRAHAQQAQVSGNLAAAAEDAAALVRMSRHVGGESPIEALVAFAVLACGTEEVTRCAPQWDRAQRDLVLTELRQIDRENPFGADATLEFDRRVSAEEGAPPADAQRFQQSKALIVQKLDEAVRLLE